MRPDGSTTAPEPETSRSSLRAVLALVAFVLAPLSWAWTIDQPFLRSSGFTAWVLLALALFLALSAAHRDRRGWVRAVAGIQLVAVPLSFWAFFVYARLPAAHVPEIATEFTLPDQDGRPVTLSSELQNGPVLLVFFRGHW